MKSYYKKEKLNREIDVFEVDEYFVQLENKNLSNLNKPYLLSELSSKENKNELLLDQDLFYFHHFEFLPNIEDDYYMELSKYTNTHEKLNCLVFEILIRDKKQIKLIDDIITYYDKNEKEIDLGIDNIQKFYRSKLSEKENNDETIFKGIDKYGFNIEVMLKDCSFLELKHYFDYEKINHWALNPKIYEIINKINKIKGFTRIHEIINTKDERLYYTVEEDIYTSAGNYVNLYYENINNNLFPPAVQKVLLYSTQDNEYNEGKIYTLADTIEIYQVMIGLNKSKEKNKEVYFQSSYPSLLPLNTISMDINWDISKNTSKSDISKLLRSIDKPSIDITSPFEDVLNMNNIDLSFTSDLGKTFFIYDFFYMIKEQKNVYDKYISKNIEETFYNTMMSEEDIKKMKEYKANKRLLGYNKRQEDFYEIFNSFEKEQLVDSKNYDISDKEIYVLIQNMLNDDKYDKYRKNLDNLKKVKELILTQIK